jgi:hypothetical protein
MKRYFHRLAYFITAYALLLICLLMAVLVAARSGLPGWVPLALALVTAAPICGVFWTIFRLLAECDDEYQRMLLVRQTLLATAFTLVIVTVWQFLEVFHLLREGPQWIAAIWFAMFGIAASITRWQA